MPTFSNSLERYVRLFNRLSQGKVVIDKWEVFGVSDSETDTVYWEVLVTIINNNSKLTDFVSVPRRRCKIFSNTFKELM